MKNVLGKQDKNSDEHILGAS